MVSRLVTTIRHWLQATRPLAQINIAVPLVLGHAAAYHVTRSFGVAWLVLSLVWGVFDHLLIVFGNDYADRDADTGRRTQISGGSGVIPEGKVSPSALRRATWIAGCALVAASLALAALGRPWAPIYTAVAIVLLWLYSFAPARLSYRGGGELLQGIGIGVGLPSFAFYLQTGAFIVPVWVFGPAIVIGTCANMLSALPDELDDRRANKRTWPVRYGVPATRRVAITGLALASFAVFLGTPDVPVQLKALVSCTPMPVWMVAARQADPFRAAWWGSVGLQLLLVGWIGVLAWPT